MKNKSLRAVAVMLALIVKVLRLPLRLIKPAVDYLLVRSKKEAAAATAEYRAHRTKVRKSARNPEQKLVLTTDVAWTETPSAKAIFDLVKEAGFEFAGSFCLESNPKVRLAGFANPALSAYASVVPRETGAAFGFLMAFEDGTEFHISNIPMKVEMPRKPGVTRIRLPDSAPDDLLAAFLRERPTQPAKPVSVKDYAKWNENDFRATYIWLAERGGWNRSELKAKLRVTGALTGEPQDKQILDAALMEEIEKSLCTWWSLQQEMPRKLEEIIETLIIVHDELSPDLLANNYWCATDDFKVRPDKLPPGTPRESFASLAAASNGKLVKIYEKLTPLEADFYLPAG